MWTLPEKNLMTREEAEKRWCPMSKLTYGSGGSFNRNIVTNGFPKNHLPEASLCVGPDCMMWRFHESGKGYCGLGGQL